jgi:hypothetical protein
MRPLIPDVVCEATARRWATVCPAGHRSDGDKRHRRRPQGADSRARRQPQLEIDLSMTGGRVTRSELHRLVVHEVSVKRWLQLPRSGGIVRAGLQVQMQADQRTLASKRHASLRQRRRRIQEAPIADIAGRYLQAVERMLIEQARLPAGGDLKPDFIAAKTAVAISVDEMAQRGYPEAGDEDLLGHHRILSRLLSIRTQPGRWVRVQHRRRGV